MRFKSRGSSGRGCLVDLDPDNIDVIKTLSIGARCAPDVIGVLDKTRRRCNQAAVSRLLWVSDPYNDVLPIRSFDIVLSLGISPALHLLLVQPKRAAHHDGDQKKRLLEVALHHASLRLSDNRVIGVSFTQQMLCDVADELSGLQAMRLVRTIF